VGSDVLEKIAQAEMLAARPFTMGRAHHDVGQKYLKGFLFGTPVKKALFGQTQRKSKIRNLSASVSCSW
jgi:hypothetical protein